MVEGDESAEEESEDEDADQEEKLRKLAVKKATAQYNDNHGSNGSIDDIDIEELESGEDEMEEGEHEFEEISGSDSEGVDESNDDVPELVPITQKQATEAARKLSNVS